MNFEKNKTEKSLSPIVTQKELQYYKIASMVSMASMASICSKAETRKQDKLIAVAEKTGVHELRSFAVCN